MEDSRQDLRTEDEKRSEDGGMRMEERGKRTEDGGRRTKDVAMPEKDMSGGRQVKLARGFATPNPILNHHQADRADSCPHPLCVFVPLW